jgi:hypothetical protein
MKADSKIRKATVSVTSHEYLAFIGSIKDKIRSAQVRAFLSVNAGLIRFHWDIGNTVVERQNQYGWGSSVIERMARGIFSMIFSGSKAFQRVISGACGHFI